MTETRKLADADVFPIGLGAMPMSLAGRPPEDQSIRTIHAALDAGVNLIDTADAYCIDASDVGHNERLIARALRGRRDGVIVATKGGHVRTADVASVQNQLSLEYPHPIAKGEVALCEERGIAFLPWAPLGGIPKAAEAAGA